jgi:CheY-like chemotaxis protein
LQSVRVDPGQVEQVLLNLVANARDAMPDGGTVTIETSNATFEAPHGLTKVDVPPGVYVVLSVTDIGSGMSPDVREHLFEPFFTTKPRGRGTGLGLANVYDIVRESGGHIFVQSEPGAGTTFSIYLPVASSSSDTRPIEEKHSAGDLTGNETILVVEDNASLRRLDERILQRYGYKVLTAANGPQAQQICAEHHGPIHVVLMDVMLPGDSGPTVGEWISQRRPETKIIYTSGYTGDAMTHRRIVDSGSVFLQKPFDAAQLARAVREVLTHASRVARD